MLGSTPFCLPWIQYTDVYHRINKKVTSNVYYRKSDRHSWQTCKPPCTVSSGAKTPQISQCGNNPASQCIRDLTNAAKSLIAQNDRATRSIWGIFSPESTSQQLQQVTFSRNKVYSAPNSSTIRCPQAACGQMPCFWSYQCFISPIPRGRLRFPALRRQAPTIRPLKFQTTAFHGFVTSG